MSILLDEKAIEKQLEDSMPSNRWYPKIKDIQAIAHAQARAIISWGNETCIQHKPFPPAKLKKRHECFKCWLQLEAELDSLLSEAGKKESGWVDRPDKAGWWWMSHWNDSFNRWDKPISVHVWHVEDYEINSGNVKWLYIEEPTPPEGR